MGVPARAILRPLAVRVGRCLNGLSECPLILLQPASITGPAVRLAAWPVPSNPSGLVEGYREGSACLKAIGRFFAVNPSLPIQQRATRLVSSS